MDTDVVVSSSFLHGATLEEMADGQCEHARLTFMEIFQVLSAEAVNVHLTIEALRQYSGYW